MSSQDLLVKGTLQAVVLGSVSNILAQGISAQRGTTPYSFDIPIFLFFFVWTLISCPPNILWQLFLEESYPANKTDPQEPEKKTLSKTNTIKKFLLDQSIGSTLNTVAYIAAISAYRGKDGSGIINEVQKDFWPLMQAGWKVWPFVALLSYTVIPLEKRTLFGSTVGLFWGVYMSLLAVQ